MSIRIDAEWEVLCSNYFFLTSLVLCRRNAIIHIMLSVKIIVMWCGSKKDFYLCIAMLL